MASLTANQLYKNAVDSKLTTLSFADWITQEGKSHVEYQNKGGELDFYQWEEKKQNNIKLAKKLTKAFVYVSVGSIIVTMIYLTIKKQKDEIN